MKSKYTLFLVFLFFLLKLHSQEAIHYKATFEKALYHQAKIEVTFPNLNNSPLSVRMSRTSPGRYAIHEFAKNVFDFSAVDSQGNQLAISRPNPYQWDISGHDGTIKITYSLFANHGDGTYSQIDETHAHLNIPATFMYAPTLSERPIKIKFYTPKDLNWKISTQLKQLDQDHYYAPNLQYFMDSPVELSNHEIKSFTINANGKEIQINFALHQLHGTEHFDVYFERVKKIVLQEMEVFGGLPDFDYGSYTFLACYVPQADGDGMEHRNSTILTSTSDLKNGGLEGNIGTVAHEFFHAWNVERIRPESLEPFDFEDANISGELWFAEGITSYYTQLMLCRAGIISKEAYASGLQRSLNKVINSPARNYFNPIEMSYQATFVDAATAVDPVNRENTFISYYTYGSVLGLALDLSLRNFDESKNLDDFMKLVWQNYGRNEVPYKLADLENLLVEYSNKDFGQNFFGQHIYKSKMPDFKKLLASVGIVMESKYVDKAFMGAQIINDDNKWLVSSNPLEESALNIAGIVKGDRIVSLNGRLTNNKLTPEEYLESIKPGEEVKVVFNRFGYQKETLITMDKNPSYTTYLEENPSNKIQKKQKKWLSDQVK